ncbi:coiled-coil domain-containing protein 113 [Lingula anatina]|uniref:Cilia- and flagella-associated protein 263 n=1 Tax=Lingula anatina TaxID=7574 RepID=A0A1S3J674_LINAN|nr:coiled-coil domain-containing protein 113-like [Lingula anatina]XP_013406483.1 coiled-coil domain-containing protein 113 [Lingula anatina]|eukprot:XP_013405917.1 coiled-coil domain-containing protein 113-like [Lingula anatina]
MAESETMSVDTSNEANDDPLQELTDDELDRLLDETLRANEVLAAETQMFEKFFKRVEPKELQGIQLSVNAAPSQSQHDVGGRGIGRKRSKSRSSHVDKSLRLTAEQKCDIAQREIEELREDIDRLKDESERVLDTYRAIMEEADIRINEIKKASYEFERDIVKGAVNTRTGKVISERVLKYLEDKIRARDTLIEKLRLKNSTLKVQKKKLAMQLKQKEEMGEVLHEVDFNQLKIENAQYLEKIDERNQDLLRLKLMAGNTLQVLNTYKKKLSTLTLESTRLKAEIASRNDLLARIDSETVTVETDRAGAEKINRKLRTQLGDYRVPEVMEYVRERADLYEMHKKVKSWERKVEIAEMGLKTHRKAWNQMRMASHQPNPWGVMETV